MPSNIAKQEAFKRRRKIRKIGKKKKKEDEEKEGRKKGIHKAERKLKSPG